jgi:hypothetical protein
VTTPLFCSSVRMGEISGKAMKTYQDIAHSLLEVGEEEKEKEKEKKREGKETCY